MSEYGKLFARIWSDPDFTQLDARPQQLYALLVSYSTRNYAGVVPLTLKRWAKSTRDATVENVTDALKQLAAAMFVVIDWDTEELLIRTFIRNDEVYRQPNLMQSARKSALQVESAALRWALHDEMMRLPEHKEVAETHRVAAVLVEGIPRSEAIIEAINKPFSEGISEGFTEGIPKGIGEGVNAESASNTAKMQVDAISGPESEGFAEGFAEGPGVGGYVSTVGNSPSPTPFNSHPSPSTSTAPKDLRDPDGSSDTDPLAHVTELDFPPGTFKPIPSGTNRSSIASEYSAEFERWWEHYPRKRGKRNAFKAWKAALKRVNGDNELLIAGAKRFAEDPGRDPKYTPYPEGWLSSDGWLDEPDPPNTTATDWTAL